MTIEMTSQEYRKFTSYLHETMPGSFRGVKMLGGSVDSWIASAPNDFIEVVNQFRSEAKQRTEQRALHSVNESLHDLARVANGQPSLKEARAAVAHVFGITEQRMTVTDYELQRIANMSSEERAALKAQSEQEKSERAKQTAETERLHRAIQAAMLIGQLQASGAEGLDRNAQERLKAAGAGDAAEHVNACIKSKSMSPTALVEYDDATLMLLVSELTGLTQTKESTTTREPARYERL